MGTKFVPVAMPTRPDDRTLDALMPRERRDAQIRTVGKEWSARAPGVPTTPTTARNYLVALGILPDDFTIPPDEQCTPIGLTIANPFPTLGEV